MSIPNWERMVEIGVADEYSATCFVAALDCLSEKQDIPYEIYARYDLAFWHQYFFGIDARRSKLVYQEVLMSALGSICDKNFVTKRAASPEQTAAIIQKAYLGRKKIILRVLRFHTVGLLHIGKNSWKMVGNNLPCHETIETDKVFSYLYVPRQSFRRDNLENIYIIN